MTHDPSEETNNDQHHLKKKGRRALIVNIIFFAALFGGVFLVPFTGIYITAAVIAAVFAISMLYIYLF